MNQTTTSPNTRRRFLKTAGAAALAAVAGPAVIIPGRAQPKTLKILRTRSFSKSFNQWFEKFVKTWGEQNGTQVILTYIRDSDRFTQAWTEIADQQGHDLFHLISPPATFEDQAIDHREVYEECRHRYGQADDVSFRSMYNPKTEKLFAFPVDGVVNLVNYRKDLWDTVDRYPDSWEDIRLGGRHIKLLHERSVGIALAPGVNGAGPDSNSALMAILFSFGGSLQDADGRPALHSNAILAAFKYIKALYQEAMSAEVLSWNSASNNRSMLADELSLTLNSVTIARAAEKLELPLTTHIRLTRPPSGPARRLTPPNVVTSYVIWKFSANIDGAKQFLVDYTGQSRDKFLVSEFFINPSFPGTLPDLAQLVASDASASPSDKYKVMAEQSDWTVNYGYPGYDNPAIADVYVSGLIPTMFANAATGKMTPEEALTQADQEVRKIYDKWRALGKV